MQKVTKSMLASSIIAILTISVFAFYSLNQYHGNEVREVHQNLETCINTFWQLLGHKGKDFRIVDGKLLVGNYPINGNFELPDKVQEIFGGVATIFMGDERVSTNVLNAEGQRALGTRLVGPAYDAVFKQGKPYRGEVSILGIPYVTAYDPIRDPTGKVVGVLFVGVKVSDSLAPLNLLTTELSLTLACMALVFTGLMALLGRAVNRAEIANENQIRFQQTLLNTIPSPIFFKDAACRYLGCNKAFETYLGYSGDELIGKTPDELWPKELAERYRQQDLALLGNPGLQVYEANVRYADGSLRDVILNKATFNDSNGSVAGLVGVILDITERKRAEEAMVFQNILLSTQLEASIDGILVVDENSKIISINRRFVEIMAIPSHLVESGEDEPVLKYVTGRMSDPDKFLAKVKHLYAHRQESCRDEISLCDGKTLDRFTVPLLGADGRYYGRLWSFRDITARKAAEDETRNAYQQLSDIVEFLPDATFVVDKDKRVIAWNRAIEQLTGIEKRDIVGKGDYAYAIPFYGDNQPLLIDLLDQEEERIRHNYTHIRQEGQTLFTEVLVPSFRNGESRYFWATATPLFGKDGKPAGGIESIRDITEYKQAEEERSLLESQLHHARMMETFMIRLGHDLRTPLTPLFVLFPLIRGRVADPELQGMVDICHRSTISMKKLVDRAQMLVSLSASINRDELAPITLVSAVESALAASADTMAQKNVACRTDVDPAVVVAAESGQLKELFANVISNAVRFSRENGTIRITAEQQEGKVTVAVDDDGIGLEPEHLERIFDEFFKADESRHDLDAPGLGLSICKRIVRNHHGRIWAESPGIGKGTTIMFTINEQYAERNNDVKESK